MLSGERVRGRAIRPERVVPGWWRGVTGAVGVVLAAADPE